MASFGSMITAVDVLHRRNWTMFVSEAPDTLTGLDVFPNGKGGGETWNGMDSNVVVYSTDVPIDPRNLEEFNTKPFANFGLFAFKDRMMIWNRTHNGARARPLYIEMGNGGTLFVKPQDQNLYYSVNGMTYQFFMRPVGPDTEERRECRGDRFY